MKQTIVLSVGGSVLVPDKVNTEFLKKFVALISKQAKAGSRFVLVVGGGITCRQYQDALRKTTKPSKDDLDWLGIASTHLNANLLRLAFGKLANPAVVTDPTKPAAFTKPILVAGGWKPGWSTDYDAVYLAHKYDAQTVINMSNIDYVYDKDPRKFRDAKKLTLIDWGSFQKIVGTTWNPGANVPFDPIATKLARKHKQKVIILNGNNLTNLAKALTSGKFVGTVIA